MNPSKLRYHAKLKRRAFLRMANHNLKMFGVPRNTQFLTAKQIEADDKYLKQQAGLDRQLRKLGIM